MAARSSYSPILEPGDPSSLPPSRLATAYVPLRADRRGRGVGRKWLHLRPQGLRLWGHSCVSDRTLRRLRVLDPLGLKVAADLGATGILTPDVPLYGFMTPAQRERAADRHLHRLLRTIELAPRQGLDVTPLVKALEAEALDGQLDLLDELGLERAALYARELLLEHDALLLRRFVRGCHARGLHPLLLGAQSPRALAWGPAELAGRHAYVLARRGLVLQANGRRRRLESVTYSSHARRFLVPGHHAALFTHNHLVAQHRIEGRTSTTLET